MKGAYDLHSWSTLYRQERLAAWHKRGLLERARKNRKPRDSRRLELYFRNTLVPLIRYAARAG